MHVRIIFAHYAPACSIQYKQTDENTRWASTKSIYKYVGLNGAYYASSWPLDNVWTSHTVSIVYGIRVTTNMTGKEVRGVPPRWLNESEKREEKSPPWHLPDADPFQVKRLDWNLRSAVGVAARIPSISIERTKQVLFINCQLIATLENIQKSKRQKNVGRATRLI